MANPTVLKNSLAPEVTAEGETYPSPRLQSTQIKAPQPGATVSLTDRVHWCRIPLPIDLDHINVWLLDCGDSYVLVDSGMNHAVCRSAWETIEAQMFTAKPLRAIFITHIHPDHIGLAAWLQERHRVPVLMSQETHAQADLLFRGIGGDNAAAFFRAHGVTDAAALGAVYSPQRVAPMMSGMPHVARCVAEGEMLDWGGQWQAWQTNGHAHGHLCLSNGSERLLIGGDQVLPTISSNVSLLSHNVDMNPLDSYLKSLQRLRTLDAGTLVLPSHGLPFVGLQQRIDDLLQHHAEKLDKVAAACIAPKSAVDVLPFMFRRKLAGINLFLALGEALAHLEYLVDVGKLQRQIDLHGLIRYSA